MVAMLQFYISCIRPIILYACPSWFSMLSKEQQQRLERIENLALKIIDPASTDYAERTSRHKVTPIIDLLDTTSQQCIEKIAYWTDHCLHNLVKSYAPKTAERQFKSLNLNRKPDTRAVLRSKCSIIHYWWYKLQTIFVLSIFIFNKLSLFFISLIMLCDNFMQTPCFY